ncbi:hypothetical protein AAG570_003876 [Ranatra chinensis]|uniref:Arrestin C-terminal-like domain-containing protein n=1 Tax=Ranatra chinensis TaxID=642074 RepID=A0ABD0Y291_9HEMI
MPCWVEPPGKPTGSPPTPRRSHPQEAHNSQAQVSRPPAAAAKPAKKKKNFLPKGSQKFSSQEKYFFHKEYLYGHKYSSYREKLVGGSHVYGFRFTLPGQLPASFNGRFGYVRYYCECTLLRWKHKDTRRVYFSVTNIADINNEAKAESGCEEQKSTNSCLFCCQRGTVIASAELKRRGYAPGEVAPVTVDIHNMSSSTITSTKAVIVQVVTYSSTQGMRSHTDERRVLEVSRGEVRPGSSRNWSGSGSRGTAAAGIRLPPLPPSSFTVDSCKIISIQYRIEVTLQ